MQKPYSKTVLRDSRKTVITTFFQDDIFSVFYVCWDYYIGLF